MALFNAKFEFGKPAETRPYLPSHTAVVLKKHDLIQPPKPTTNPGLLVANGRIGGASNGGAVLLGNEEWGFDFVAAEGDSKKVYLLPSDKDAVEVDKPEDNIGRLRQSGMPILSNDGKIVVPGIITYNRWRAEQARYQNTRVTQIAPALWSILPNMPTRAEIVDIDPSGITTAYWLPS